MRNIIYVGEVIGTPNTAMHIHCQNVAKIFREIGYNVIFVCRGTSDEEYSTILGGFNYFYTKRKYKYGFKKKVESFFETIYGKSLFSCFLKIANEFPPSMILYYGYSAEKKLIKFARKKRIPIIIERVDWFESSDRKGLYSKIIEQGIVDYAYRKLDFDASGIIAISNYIEQYFLKKKEEVLLLPPVFDSINDNIKPYMNGEPIKLVYCGSLGNGKDNIFSIIDAIVEVNATVNKYILNIVGVSEEHLRNHYDIKKIKESGIVIHGTLENSVARTLIQNCDFSILLRKNKRYARAGFSTKFAESMCLGVPVICNAVGGADTIISNKINGIIAESDTKEDVVKVLKEILSFDQSEINYIKTNALEFAANYFNYMAYVNQMELFIQKLEKNH